MAHTINSVDAPNIVSLLFSKMKAIHNYQG